MKIDYISIGYWPIVGGTETVVKNVAERILSSPYCITTILLKAFQAAISVPL